MRHLAHSPGGPRSSLSTARGGARLPRTSQLLGAGFGGGERAAAARRFQMLAADAETVVVAQAAVEADALRAVEVELRKPAVKDLGPQVAAKPPRKGGSADRHYRGVRPLAGQGASMRGTRSKVQVFVHGGVWEDVEDSMPLMRPG